MLYAKRHQTPTTLGESYKIVADTCWKACVREILESIVLKKTYYLSKSRLRSKKGTWRGQSST